MVPVRMESAKAICVVIASPSTIMGMVSLQGPLTIKSVSRYLPCIVAVVCMLMDSVLGIAMGNVFGDTIVVRPDFEMILCTCVFPCPIKPRLMDALPLSERQCLPAQMESFRGPARA